MRDVAVGTEVILERDRESVCFAPAPHDGRAPLLDYVCPVVTAIEQKRMVPSRACCKPNLFVLVDAHLEIMPAAMASDIGESRFHRGKCGTNRHGSRRLASPGRVFEACEALLVRPTYQV